MFAWILENFEGVSASYVHFLYDKMKNPSFNSPKEMTITISTQTQVKNGRIDLFLKVYEKIGFICEHKIHSELSANQIQKYIDESSSLGTEQNYSVLLTFSTSQHTQYADVVIVWSEIQDNGMALLSYSTFCESLCFSFAYRCMPGLMSYVYADIKNGHYFDIFDLFVKETVLNHMSTQFIFPIVIVTVDRLNPILKIC